MAEIPASGAKITHVKWGDNKKKIKHFVQQAVGMSTLTSPSSQYAGDGCTPVFPITRSHSKLETAKISLLPWQFAMLTDSTFLAFGVMREDCE